MKKLITICAVMTMILALSSVAQATATWQTTPVLGIDSSYTGDVLINNGGSPWANIPHDVDATAPDHTPDAGGPQPASITTFYVGQQVHTGSGVFVDNGVSYDWTADFIDLTDGSRNQSYTGSFTGSGGFWMTWNTPNGGGDGGGVPTLTSADIGNWQYIETYTWTAGGGGSLSHTTNFQVIPAPGALLLGSMGMGIVGWLRRRRMV